MGCTTRAVNINEVQLFSEFSILSGLRINIKRENWWSLFFFWERYLTEIFFHLSLFVLNFSYKQIRNWIYFSHYFPSLEKLLLFIFRDVNKVSLKVSEVPGGGGIDARIWRKNKKCIWHLFNPGNVRILS